MHRAAVIYAPNDEAMRSLAERIAGSLDRKRFSLKVMPAAEAIATDLTAADLLLLGGAPKGRSQLHPEFSELARALAGMSLAGRVAGLFAAEAEGPLAALRKILKDTEVQLEAEGSLRADLANDRELAAWLYALTAQVDGIRRGR